jgi:hypothetical protein
MLPLWAPEPERAEIHHLLETADAVDSAPFLRLESRFRDWYAWTVNLAGTYYASIGVESFIVSSYLRDFPLSFVKLTKYPTPQLRIFGE